MASIVLLDSGLSLSPPDSYESPLWTCSGASRPQNSLNGHPLGSFRNLREPLSCKGVKCVVLRRGQAALSGAVGRAEASKQGAQEVPWWGGGRGLRKEEGWAASQEPEPALQQPPCSQAERQRIQEF